MKSVATTFYTFLSPAGKMALNNYLVQSVICCFGRSVLFAYGQWNGCGVQQLTGYGKR